MVISVGEVFRKSVSRVFEGSIESFRRFGGFGKCSRSVLKLYVGRDVWVCVEKYQGAAVGPIQSHMRTCKHMLLQTVLSLFVCVFTQTETGKRSVDARRSQREHTCADLLCV